MTIDWARGWPNALSNRHALEKMMADYKKEEPDMDPRYAIVLSFVAVHIITGPFAIFIDGVHSD